ncbi:MAG: MoaD/ThiS family protein [Limnohabitans sp.]
MKVNVRYFAALREAIGVASEVIETHAADVAGLRAELMAKGGAYAQCLAPGRAVRVAVNQVMASDGAALSADAEVGFFPPVTGG